VSIANFTQSSYELGYAFKYLRVLSLLLTAAFDIWGFAASLFIAVLLAACNRTADGRRRFLWPLVPWNARAMKRLVFRLRKED
ncbi:MAG: spore germination protein, partial [Clostridia bacterium]|nr:spore germination protein [Clostridia bacterium]